MNERFHTLNGSGTHNMSGSVHLSSVDELNRNALIGKSDKENMFSKDDKLQSNGQSSSDNSSLLNNSLGGDSSYQSVEDKTVRGSCTDHDVIESTRDAETLDPRHEDIGSHGDNISCVSGIDKTEDQNSGVDKVEDQFERENGSNGATSANKTPFMDKMVDKLVDKFNSSESPSLNDRSPKVGSNGATSADKTPLMDKMVNKLVNRSNSSVSTLSNDRSPKVSGSLIEVEGAKDLEIKERSEKLCAPPLPSQLADTKVASSTIEDEVRVCDICGDLGREYMLAICSKCSDGAEHIYCMRVPMDKVPEGDWLCEDCKEKQESEVQNQFKADTLKETLMRSSSIKNTMPKPQSLVSSTTLRKPLSFERRKPSTVVSPSTNDVSLLRKRTLEAYAESPKVSSPKRRLVKPFVQNASIGNSATSNLKSRLLKSKSFNVMDLKLKDRLSRQDSLKTPTMNKDVCEKKFQKSRSFNNADTSTSDIAKKMVIGARQTIEPISTNKISASKSGLSELNKKVTPHGKMVLPTSKASPRDREGPQSCILPSSPLARKGSIKTEPFPKPKGLDSCESNTLINIRRVLSVSSQDTVIPRIDRAWRGSFEVSTGRWPCTRIQAHCSSRASDNVLDLVRKLPTKIVLEELPRRTVSPAQFTEDSIAMFFFAEDLKSYGDYKIMLKRMMDKDFSFRGRIDGAELLVFSSSILPLNSQRWNNLLFLWGLFRRRPAIDVPDSSATCSGPCLVKTEPCLPKTTPHRNSDQMVRASEIVKEEKRKLLPVNGSNHLRRSSEESPVSLKLFPEAGQLCSMSKVCEEQFLDPKPLGGYENQDYEMNEERSNKRMKSFGASGGFHFGTGISLGPPLATIDECEGVDLELSLGIVQKRESSRSRDDEVGSVSLSLSLGLPFS